MSTNPGEGHLGQQLDFCCPALDSDDHRVIRIAGQSSLLCSSALALDGSLLNSVSLLFTDIGSTNVIAWIDQEKSIRTIDTAVLYYIPGQLIDSLLSLSDCDILTFPRFYGQSVKQLCQSLELGRAV